MKDKKTAIQEENRRARKGLWKIILASVVVGGVLGFFSALLANAGLGGNLLEQLTAVLMRILPWGIPVSSLILLGVGGGLYRKSARQFAAWNGEDETDTMEEPLNWALAATSLQTLLNFFFLAAALLRPGSALLVAGETIVSFAAVCWLQQKVVDLVRQLYPEKRGSIYDTNFQKEWWDSCDEFERAQIGQASYAAYKAVGIACIVLWGAAVLLNVAFSTGLLPVVMVLTLWGVLQGAYLLEVIRLGRRKTVR